ncbi:MAG: PH domain-containing protein [Kiritimatiellia bacterium]|jgi:uncharacterized membrane protein YdbT with pleckstrin-like domain|nr:PH domain-containing protein [Kiritimatiellia bacterium]
MNSDSNRPLVPDETPIFDTHPSGAAYIGLIIWGLLLLPLFLVGLLLLLRAWYLVASTRYQLTTQRLFVHRGLVAKHVEEVELFRIKDVTLTQGVLERLLGVGQVVVLSTDDTTPRLELKGLRQPLQVKEQIRTAFRAARRHEGMRTTEFIPS